MKALVWHGERELALEELPDPVPAPGEVVLEVALAGICGSDLHGYRGHPGPRVPPLVLGHEAVGRARGGVYTVYPLLACGTCARCRAGEDNLCEGWRLLGMHRPGVFAERVAVPERSLVAVPAGLAPERAVLAEPLACCVGALAPHEVGPATHVLVLGCGPIGLLTAFAAARAGAEVTAVDPVAARRAHAERLGAAAVVADAGEIALASFDLAVDAAGFETTWRAAIDAVRNGGSVVVVGLGQAEGALPIATLVRRSIRLRGQFAYSRTDFAAALELLAAGDLDLAWVDEAPLADGARAFAELVDRPGEHSKVLLRP
ncbi:MAG TPA: alcohol dehydrogenase catalytic domain-containing protein [Gaiellaceae bacterium]|nr:alcohol dehydrogenase catalytic domain-containing protein [Gaiellaceae bacterium]